MNRKYAPLELTEEDYETVLGILERGKHSARTIKRARVLLGLHQQSGNYEAIAEESGYKTTATVCLIAGRYRQGGLQAALYDAKRPGQPQKFSADDQARITAIACSEPPEERTKWTLRLLADKIVELELSDKVAPATVGAVLKKTNFDPTRRSNGVSAN